MMTVYTENKTMRLGEGGVGGEEFQLVDLLVIFIRHKAVVIGMPFIAGLAALAYSLSLSPIFTSTTKIMLPQQQGAGVSAMLGQLGGLAGVAGGVAGFKSSNDLYVGILESRTIADALILRMKLKEHFESKTMDDARKALASVTQIRNDKSGMIIIDVVDSDPRFAADLANAYFEEFTSLTQSMALTEASKRRLFFEKQLKAGKEQLASAEVALRQTQESTGVIQLEGQVQGIMANVAQLKGTIAAKEVQFSAMRTFATSQNPDMLRIQEEIRSLKAQLEKLERGNSVKTTRPFSVAASKIPEVGVEYVRRLRDVKYHETMFELLVKQYESAKLDEAKEFSVVQQLDRAVPAERKSGPKRALITLSGTFAGSILGILLAFAREAFRRQRISDGRAWRKLSAAWNKTSA